MEVEVGALGVVPLEEGAAEELWPLGEEDPEEFVLLALEPVEGVVDVAAANTVIVLCMNGWILQ